MSTEADLPALNHALGQLVNLQLSGELEANEAFQQRRQLLDAVEDSWQTLCDQPVQSAEGDGASHTGLSWLQRLQVIPLVWLPSALHWLLIRSWRLSLSALLLLLALTTFWYVGSL